MTLVTRTRFFRFKRVRPRAVIRPLHAFDTSRAHFVDSEASDLPDAHLADELIVHEHVATAVGVGLA